jgi:hypothetical protein
VAPSDAPPYREAIPGREQELDQEATPGRLIFFKGQFFQNQSCSCCSPQQCDSELFLLEGTTGPRPKSATECEDKSGDRSAALQDLCFCDQDFRFQQTTSLLALKSPSGLMYSIPDIPVRPVNYIPTNTNYAEPRTSRAHFGPLAHFRAWEVVPRAAIRRSNQTTFSAYKVACVAWPGHGPG